MIISATRRADIPAHYPDWFMNRVRAGYCLVPNPFNARQVARVPLTPESVSAVVFWTRDPRPLIPSLKELDGLGYNYYFQFTLVEYPPALHPHPAPLASRVTAFLRLADLIGPEKVLWRYDPIVLCTDADADFHRRSFAALARALSGATVRVTVSLMEPYRKTRRRLRDSGVDLLAPTGRDLADMFRHMAEAAGAAGMVPVSCSDESGLADLGFAPGACLDQGLLNRLFSLDLPPAKDPAQRPACRCLPSRDIGMYDACAAGCVYCYATRDFALAKANRRGHDPGSPCLIGWPREPT